MKVGKEGLELIKSFEGLKLKAYLCSAKVETIGYGTTIYPDGDKVKLGDVVSKQEAELYFLNDLGKFEKGVMSLVKNVKLSVNQFSALVSFAYNLGLGALGKSTLLKKVLVNPNDPTIGIEFLKWDKAAGKVISGLTRRRKAEWDLYNKK
jgi:lysozyme